MAEKTQTTPWDEINVDESISEEEQAASQDISMASPVGKFLCSVVGCDAIEKNFSKYTCYAASMKFQIENVLEIEQTVLGEDNKPVKRSGEVLKKVMTVDSGKLEAINALNAGKFLFDEVNLFNVKEKEAMKKRRLFVAKKLGLIGQQATQIQTKDWANAVGQKVIITTEWNQWKDKDTDELRRNVKVSWDGYESAKVAYDDVVPFDDGENAKTEDFDI